VVHLAPPPQCHDLLLALAPLLHQNPLPPLLPFVLLVVRDVLLEPLGVSLFLQQLLLKVLMWLVDSTSLLTIRSLQRTVQTTKIHLAQVALGVQVRTITTSDLQRLLVGGDKVLHRLPGVVVVVLVVEVLLQM
jgi:hypothetical protein